MFPEQNPLISAITYTRDGKSSRATLTPLSVRQWHMVRCMNIQLVEDIALSHSDGQRTDSALTSAVLAVAKAILIGVCGGAAGGAVAFSTVTVSSGEVSYFCILFMYFGAASSGIGAIMVWIGSHRLPLPRRRPQSQDMDTRTQRTDLESTHPEFFFVAPPDTSRCRSKEQPRPRTRVLRCVVSGLAGYILSASISHTLWWFVLLERGLTTSQEAMSRGSVIYLQTGLVGAVMSMIAYVCVARRSWE